MKFFRSLTRSFSSTKERVQDSVEAWLKESQNQARLERFGEISLFMPVIALLVGAPGVLIGGLYLKVALFVFCFSLGGAGLYCALKLIIIKRRAERLLKEVSASVMIQGVGVPEEHVAAMLDGATKVTMH